MNSKYIDAGIVAKIRFYKYIINLLIISQVYEEKKKIRLLQPVIKANINPSSTLQGQNVAILLQLPSGLPKITMLVANQISSD